MAAITTAVAVGTAAASSAMASRSARKQKKELRKGTRKAIDALDTGYEDQKNYLNPYRDFGLQGMEALQDPLANFYASPDYEFRRSEGLKDLGNQFAAKGSGGNAMKALADYTSNLASGEFGNWYERMFRQSEVGRQTSADLAGLAGNRYNTEAGMQFKKGKYNADIAGQKYTNIGNSINNLGQNLMAIYSDRRLKTNIQQIDTVNGYPWYSFDWKDGGSSEGFMSDEVPRRFVSRDARGYEQVDYYGVIRS